MDYEARIAPTQLDPRDVVQCNFHTHLEWCNGVLFIGWRSARIQLGQPSLYPSGPIFLCYPSIRQLWGNRGMMHYCHRYDFHVLLQIGHTTQCILQKGILIVLKERVLVNSTHSILFHTQIRGR